jgi:1,5-anhydro-D-fructose reductase (1,5-anhydro-D-mannitol-forming)
LRRDFGGFVRDAHPEGDFLVIRWALAGIGDIAVRRVIPAILEEPRSELYGLITRAPQKAEPYRVRFWTDFDEALRDSNIDAVYIATPVCLHATQTIAALRAGKHVLCEKPMAMTFEEAQAMQRAAEETGRTLGIAYYRRTYPKVQRARQLIAEGVIGRPVFAEINSHGWFDDVNGPRGWLLNKAMAGGGPLYDIGSHRIDLLNYFFGQPARVSAHLANVVHQREVEDAATVVIEYESGVRAVVDVRWHSRVERDEFRIIGTDGEIELSPLNGPELVSPAGIEQLPTHANIHYPLVEGYVSALVDGAQPISSGATAMLTDWVTARSIRVPG